MAVKRRYSRRRRTSRRRRPLVSARGMQPTFKAPRIQRRALRITARSKLNRNPGAGAEVIMPEIYRALPYYDTYALNFGTFTYALRQFRMNSLYDPDLTGVGHSPRGFDQFALLYSNYQVYACVCEVIFTTKDTTNDTWMCFIGALDSQSTPPLNQIELNEKPNGPSAKGFLTNTNRRCVLRQYYHCAAVEGIDKTEYNSIDAYQAPVTGNPNVSPQVYVGAYTLDGSTGTSLDIHVNMTFMCKFFRPKAVAIS